MFIPSEEQRKLRKKQVIAIRLSPETAEKVKALGKGYSSVLSRIIDEAFKTPEFLRKCL
ncbi:BrnA antitoxin family protein [Treponema parvum]|uniref:BrnA antitoxin family protein n=1 Tax=Treponema parvum TaxID=138851 RepID=UPI001FE4A76C|nr:BrnA antitoxin family protein [Treponema parvum]